MPSCQFEAYPFTPVTKHLALEGAASLNVTLSTSYATVVSVMLRNDGAQSPLAKKVIPTSGVNAATVSFTDLQPSAGLLCEVHVDAELGAAQVQVGIEW